MELNALMTPEGYASLQEKIATDNTILGLEVIGVDGLRTPYKGTVEKITRIQHAVLGLLVQIWVKWENQGEHLEPFFPRQFKPFTNDCRPGVYVKLNDGCRTGVYVKLNEEV